VVGFIKKNFAKNRVYQTIDKWNEQCIAWLERTGNGKVHNTTKKRPVEVFALEKQHLRLITTKIIFSSIDSSITRTVRKDNTILYLSNRYSVPLGTYKKDKEVYIEVTDKNHLLVREEQEGSVIADHIISQEKGKLIQDRQHTRDRTKGISAYITSVSGKFEDVKMAHEFLTEVHRKYPRYIRDQLQLISKALESDPEFANGALKECVSRQLYSANEFSDIVQHVKRQRQVDNESEKRTKQQIKPLYAVDESVIHTKPQTRDVNTYLALLEGGASR